MINKNGGGLVRATVRSVKTPGQESRVYPPMVRDQDWVVLIKK